MVSLMDESMLCIHELAPGTCSICNAGGAAPRSVKREPDLRVESCRSCDAPIVWVITENSKPMPVDAEPNPVEGRFVMAGQTVGSNPTVHYVKNSELETNTKPMFTSHFANCPDSEGWKRSR